MAILRTRSFLFLCLLGFAAALVLDFISGRPGLVDEPLSLGLWLGLVGHFALWLAGLHGWGQQLARAANLKHPTPGVALGLGSFLYAGIAFFLSVLGLLRPELRFLLFAVNAIGLAFALPSWRNYRISLRREILVSVILALPLALYLALHLLDCFFLSPYWDPLHHHLVGPRLWWERGRLYFPDTAIATYQEGGFEQLFLWPHFFFANTGGRGLVPVQLFAQLTHFAVGFCGSLALVHALAKRWLPLPTWHILALLLCAGVSSLHFAIPTAKNDWGIILWVLCGFVLFLEEKNSSALAWGGLLWGFAWLGKLSAAFSLLGLSGVLLFSRRSRRDLLLFTGTFCAGALPLALRNFLGTGDPLFPLYANLFPTTALGPTWRMALAKYQSGFEFSRRARDWLMEFPLSAAALLSPGLAFLPKEPAELRAVAIGIPVGLGAFLLFSGPAAELRLLGALLPFSALLVVVLFERLSHRLPHRFSLLLPVVLGLFGTVLLPYRFEALRRAQAIPRTELLPRSYISGSAQGWFRDHYQEGMRAAMLVDPRTYHSLPYPVVYLWDAPALDTRLRAASSLTDFFRILRAEGFTHLILSQEKLDLFYPQELVGEVERYVLRHPEALVFQTHYSLVADLRLLLPSLDSAAH